MSGQVSEREKWNQIYVAIVFKPLKSCHIKEGRLSISFLF